MPGVAGKWQTNSWTVRNSLRASRTGFEIDPAAPGGVAAAAFARRGRSARAALVLLLPAARRESAARAVFAEEIGRTTQNGELPAYTVRADDTVFSNDVGRNGSAA